MDINSLLSPSDSPASTPTPPTKPPTKRPRKPRASKLSNSVQATSSPVTTSRPTSLPRNAVVQAQIVAPPQTVSPVPGLRMHSAVTPPIDGTRSNRQPSTPGMDTLADLASMQHHQQTARANAGGLRSAEIYDSQTSSPANLPNLQAMPRSQGPSMLRGSSFDRPMVDVPTHTPSPRTYAASSLSESELQTVTQLAAYIAANPFAYEHHVQLINTLHQSFLTHVRRQTSSKTSDGPHTYDLLQDLQSAREAMNTRFALGEDLLADWIQDNILLASSLEDRISIMELCQRAVEEETTSAKLWLIYAQWMLSLYKNANVNDDRASGIGAAPRGLGWSEEDKMVAREVFSWQQMMNVWRRGSQETMWRINDSQLLWDPYTELLLQELTASPSREAVTSTHRHFQDRLRTPHSTWDQTFQIYSNFVSKYDNANYEATMVAVSRVGGHAKQKYEMRDFKEIGVLRAVQKNDREAELAAFADYIEYESTLNRKKQSFDFDLLNALYQRATLRFPSNTELWEGYAMFLIEEISFRGKRKLSVLPVLEKATRHCPWSGNLWSQYLLAAEIAKLPFTDIGDIKHKATSTGLLDAGGMEEVLKVHTAWCGFLRRRAFQQGATDEEMDVAEVGIRSAIEDMDTLGRNKYGKEYQGDPEYRLEKIYIKYLTQCRNWNGARETFKKLIPKRGDSHDFWLRYYVWEMTTWCKLAYSENDPNGGRLVKPTEATKVLQQALKRPNLDWPEKILETFQYHCEDHEDAEELQSAAVQVSKTTRAVKRRREKEAYEAYEVAQAQALQQQEQAQQEVAGAVEESGNAIKRKRENNVEGGPSKRSRSEGNGEAEGQAHEAQEVSAPSHLKRDRENATVVVKNLPADTTETRLRQYFRDCGTINSLKLSPEANGLSATASIEFESKEDVLTAQTKDMKFFDGNAIGVQVGSGSTLYVCNFPPTADEDWIRQKFQQFGTIVDIRFPSLKYDTHRRFCYVQFKFQSQAEAATQLDGEDFEDGLKLVAKISDPAQKQSRQGAIYEGRELFLANVHREASTKEIKQCFRKCGYVESVRMPRKVDGTPKGIAFVVFRDLESATTALEMNGYKIRNRPLSVMLSTNDMSKRQANRIVPSASTSVRASNSSAPENKAFTNGTSHDSASPAPTTTNNNRSAEIQSRTLALLNVPDTVNDARIRALASPHGELVRVLLRPDHQGAILEYKDVTSVGKASLGLSGYEITPGRAISVGTVAEMMQLKAEKRSDRIGTGPKSTSAALQSPAPVRRPTQATGRRGGKGGLGFKRDGGGLSGRKAEDHGNVKTVEVNGAAEKDGGEQSGTVKSNADFKAMFLHK